MRVSESPNACEGRFRSPSGFNSTAPCTGALRIAYVMGDDSRQVTAKWKAEGGGVT